MWRTLVINTAERIKLKDNRIIVETETEEEVFLKTKEILEL